jgi:hypothetical protein
MIYTIKYKLKLTTINRFHYIIIQELNTKIPVSTDILLFGFYHKKSVFLVTGGFFGLDEILRTYLICVGSVSIPIRESTVIFLIGSSHRVSWEETVMFSLNLFTHFKQIGICTCFLVSL